MASYNSQARTTSPQVIMAKFRPMPPLAELQHRFDYDSKTGVFRHRNTRKQTLVGTVAGTVTRRGYIELSFEGRMLLAHRVAWYFDTGADPLNQEVDHENRVKYDNKISNLRLASHRNNQANKIHKGVFFCKRRRKYVARIRVGDGRHQMDLGRFDREDDAQAAYQAKHIEIHGEFSPYCATLTEFTT